MKAPGHMSLDEVVPQVGDILGLLSGFFFAAQIFRAEMLCSKFDPLKLTAVQLVFMFLVASGWEAWTLGVGGGGLGPNLSQLEGQLSQLPWGPLLYSGLLAGGKQSTDQITALTHALMFSVVSGGGSRQVSLRGWS